MQFVLGLAACLLAKPFSFVLTHHVLAKFSSARNNPTLDDAHRYLDIEAALANLLRVTGVLLMAIWIIGAVV